MNMSSPKTVLIVISLFITASCGHESGRGTIDHSPLPNKQEDSQFSIVGSWKNETCTKVIWDEGSKGRQDLWYHETIILTETTGDSINTYFIDPECQHLDSYQPTPHAGGLYEYTLGAEHSQGIREMNFNYHYNEETFYSIINRVGDEIRFGIPENAEQNASTPEKRFTRVDERTFKLIE